MAESDSDSEAVSEPDPKGLRVGGLFFRLGSVRFASLPPLGRRFSELAHTMGSNLEPGEFWIAGRAAGWGDAAWVASAALCLALWIASAARGRGRPSVARRDFDRAMALVGSLANPALFARLAPCSPWATGATLCVSSLWIAAAAGKAEDRARTFFPAARRRWLFLLPYACQGLWAARLSGCVATLYAAPLGCAAAALAASAWAAALERKAPPPFRERAATLFAGSCFAAQLVAQALAPAPASELAAAGLAVAAAAALLLSDLLAPPDQRKFYEAVASRDGEFRSAREALLGPVGERFLAHCSATGGRADVGAWREARDRLDGVLVAFAPSEAAKASEPPSASLARAEKALRARWPGFCDRDPLEDRVAIGFALDSSDDDGGWIGDDDDDGDGDR